MKRPASREFNSKMNYLYNTVSDELLVSQLVLSKQESSKNVNGKRRVSKIVR